MPNFTIDYAGILETIPGEHREEITSALLEELPRAWIDAYRDMVGRQTSVYQFNDGGFEFLFDIQSELDTPPEDHIDDRVVAAFGRSLQVYERRDSSRMKGFLRGVDLRVVRKGPEGEEQVRMDRGHMMAHTMGGRTDVNLFPQRREVNRGWSERGKIYRKMERYCADNPGVFCFSRPIYRDDSWIPFEVEYGVLIRPRELWVERFKN